MVWDGEAMASVLRKTGRLYRLLYGQEEADQGSVRMRAGTVTYSFDTDRFVLVDNEGCYVYGTDGGWDVERWMILNGWIVLPG